MNAYLRQHPDRVMRSTEDDGSRTQAAKQQAEQRKQDRKAKQG